VGKLEDLFMLMSEGDRVKYITMANRVRELESKFLEKDDINVLKLREVILYHDIGMLVECRQHPILGFCILDRIGRNDLAIFALNHNNARKRYREHKEVFSIYPVNRDDQIYLDILNMILMCTETDTGNYMNPIDKVLVDEKKYGEYSKEIKLSYESLDLCFKMEERYDIAITGR